MHIIPYTDESW